MSEPADPLGLHLHLARAAELRRRPWVRDKFLVLAGVTAAERGLDQIAACCRQKILAHNPGHLVGRYPGLASALEDERFQGFLTQLRRRYTGERAEHMLASLGIDLAREREAYFSDHEYAAALLATTVEELESRFGESGQPGQTETPAGQPCQAGASATEPANSQSVHRTWWMLLVIALLAAATFAAAYSILHFLPA